MNTFVIESKLPKVSTSIFTIMSKMALDHGAINLSQGFPDFEVDKELIDLVLQQMQKGHNQYAPMAGVPALREQISNLTFDLYGTRYNPETEITVTSGATEALFCAITALVQEEDEVLVIEPAYDSYIPAIELSGGNPVTVSLEYPDYTIDWEKVKKIINQRTRVIIINSPHNPTGSTLKESDLQELEKLVENNDIFVISDEVYEHILFDGQSHQSIARFPGLVDKSMIISSFGKTFHATGWKVGYCLAPERLTTEFRKVHQYVTFSTITPIQYALAEYMQDRTRITQLGAYYQQKRDYFLELMQDSPFKPLQSEGSYFQLMSYEGISDEADTDFAARLTRDYGVASIPVSVFYRNREDHKVLRFCFAKQNETLEAASKKLRSVRGL